ncbi:hypothetical protein O9H85_22935 [Paenibacillus filicis]|uniref:Exosporium protein C n=1 Tax=Paenibacillus gyeongsangnamensis TaxID=3388067 RepID=A0ABT4QEE1_9BACL|nr:hypothetical protein [Paenibacillus filicis]MCZ8515219.1 hypothetical protein [Paenibacillus filicis]
MPRTTGPILNNGLAATIDLVITNDSEVLTVIFDLEVFIINGSGIAKTPIVHELFSIPPLANINKTFSIAGAQAFELQADATATDGTGGHATANIFSTDTLGNLIFAGRVLGSETEQITALTPVP